MTFTFILIAMLFCHIVDDYYLQGWLVSAKQKKYWKENAPDDLYQYDYIMALVMHSLSWSFMITLPLVIYFEFNCGMAYCIMILINMIIHAIVDNLKANKHKISLVIDQLIHIMQIIITYIIAMCLNGI